MYLMPNPDRDVLLRDPRSRVALPSYGGNVPNTSFWVRREMDGDAIETTPEDIAKGRAEAEKAAEKATEKFKAEAKAKADADAKEAKATKPTANRPTRSRS